MQTWGDAVTRLSGGYQKVTSGNLNTARVDLTQAQTKWWKGRHQEVEDALHAREAEVGEQQSGAMQRAYLSAKTRLQAAGMSEDERETIALQTALNSASGRNETEAFEMARTQESAAFDQASRQWQAENDAYLRGAPNANQPGPAPNPANYFTIGAPNTVPTVVNIQVPSYPGGPPRNLNMVKYGSPQPATQKLAPIGDTVAAWRKQGLVDPVQLRKKLATVGYSTSDINNAVPIPHVPITKLPPMLQNYLP